MWKSEDIFLITNVTNIYETSWTRKIKFYILLTFQIPSILCSLYLFYHLIQMRELHGRLHLHSVISLLIYNFLLILIELSMTLGYLHTGEVRPSRASYCLFRLYFKYTIFVISCWCMAIASIQRYILIFHRHLIQTRQGLISLHYLPIIFIPIFFFLWYFILIFFYPCVQHFDFTQAWCSGACYLDQLIMGTIDWIVSSWLPVLLTIIFNLLLIIRFIRACRKMQRVQTWKTNRKLVTQLLFITCLFLIHYLLFIVLSTIQLWINSIWLAYLDVICFAYLIYGVPIFIPFVSLISLPEIARRIKRIFYV